MGCGEDAEKSAALQLSADALESIVTGSQKKAMVTICGWHVCTAARRLK